MLHPEEDELLLADRLVLLDEHVARAVGVVYVLDLAPGLVALPAVVCSLVGQGGRSIEPVGDEPEEDLAEPRCGERRDEVAETGPSGLAIRSGTTRSRGTRWALAGGGPMPCTARSATGLLVAGKGVGAEHAVAEERCERLAELGVQVVAALGRVGGRLESSR